MISYAEVCGILQTGGCRSKRILPISSYRGQFMRRLPSPIPGDDGGSGPLFDRDALNADQRAASDGIGVIRHGTGQPVSEIGVAAMEGQKRDRRSEEVLDVLGLGFVTASGIGFLLLGKALGGSLGVEFATNPLDGRC